MPVWFILVAVVPILAGVVFVFRKMRTAVVTGWPLEEGEERLLEEEHLTLWHREFRQTKLGKGGETMFRVRALLTNRRILIASGGPEGKHKLVLQVILDYTHPAEQVAETGIDAYMRKFHLGNGYPTYPFTAADMTADEKGFKVVVPFPEGGRWEPPQVELHTKQAARYLKAVKGS